ncbi:MAG TPA: SOS response-associated peptidase [Acidimicrobiales bacterium]|nr:SOS response-associated peptidase [Acidimicrobiales bacterium]
MPDVALMCGRFVAASSPTVIADYLRVDEIRTEALDPSWNVAPTDAVYAVAESRDDTRLLGAYTWGLVPSWAKDRSIGARMINARAETVSTKFKASFERRRCLLPADGFYEWEKKESPTTGKTVKQPWFVHRADGAPLVFAGLWEVWWPPGVDRDAEPPLRTCTIITTEANDLLRPIHDRMPVLLAPSDWDAWLDRDNADTEGLRSLLVPADPRALEMFEVSPRVNSVKNNDGELVLPINSR